MGRIVNFSKVAEKVVCDDSSVKMTVEIILHLTLDNIAAVENDNENKDLAVYQKEYC